MGCSPLFYGYVSDPQSSSRVISKENFLVSGSLKKSPLCVDPLQKKKSLPLWKISLCLDLSAKEKNIFSPPLCPFLCPQEKIPLCSDLSLLIYMTTHIYMEYSVSFFNARGYMESAYMWLTLDTLSKMQPASRIRESGLCLSFFKNVEKSPISIVWFSIPFLVCPVFGKCLVCPCGCLGIFPTWPRVFLQWNVLILQWSWWQFAC